MSCNPSKSMSAITDALMSLIFFFFFQAEDGIRDHCVTGVQTCALPIYGLSARNSPTNSAGLGCGSPLSSTHIHLPSKAGGMRSEERRVGKEGRSGGVPYG